MNQFTSLIDFLARAEREKELDDAFNSAENINERMEIFIQMREFASTFDHQTEIAKYGSLLNLSKYSSSIILNLLMLPLQKPQQVFSFGKAALTVFAHTMTCFGSLPPNIPIHNHNARIRTHLPADLHFACLYYLLGSACLGLERHYESLNFLELAVTKSHDLLKNIEYCDRNCVYNLLAATHQQLYNIRVIMGKQDEAILHAREALKNKKLMLNDTDCIELGDAYFEAYKAFVDVRNIKEAMPLCLKALNIYSKCHGPFSREVALLRVDLVVLYYVQGNLESSDHEIQLWRDVLVSSSSEYLNAEVKTANMLIHFRRCEEAFNVMSSVASCTDMGRGGRVTSLVKMASACWILGRYNDAKKYMGEAKRLEEKDVDPIFFGNEFVNMAIMYEKMKDFDTAVSLYKRVLEMAEYYVKVLPEGTEKLSHQKLFAVSCARLFSLFGRHLLLVSLADWEKEDMLLFMMGMMKKLEEIFGLEHIEVGYGYARLGVALTKSGKASLAVTLFENAISIMDVCLGTHHMDSLRTSHILYEIYVKQRRFFEATEIKAKIIQGSKGLGPSEQQVMETLLDY